MFISLQPQSDSTVVLLSLLLFSLSLSLFSRGREKFSPQGNIFAESQEALIPRPLEPPPSRDMKVRRVIYAR